jgi:hypothetical protein
MHTGFVMVFNMLATAWRMRSQSRQLADSMAGRGQHDKDNQKHKRARPRPACNLSKPHSSLVLHFEFDQLQNPSRQVNWLLFAALASRRDPAHDDRTGLDCIYASGPVTARTARQISVMQLCNTLRPERVHGLQD